MDSRKSIRNLGETLEALLGSKLHLTPNWVKSVCDIAKTLPDDDNAASDTITKLKDELGVLGRQINQLNAQRKQVLNDFLDMKGNIRVFCRIRPMTLGEHFSRVRPVVAVNSSDVLLKLADNKSKRYNFDRVFHPGSLQEDVFSEVEPVVKSALDGYNACIFAYGQTGAGKTFTMEGTSEEPGVVPRTFEALFKQAGESNHSFLISFSMLEIYMGNLKDLLVLKPTRPTDPISPCLSVQTDPAGGIVIENLISIQVNEFQQALKLYRLGCRLRSTASTNSNVSSSRSHCMIRMAITCFDAPERRRETNKIWLVDLGGSERVLKTKAWGKRLNEGKAINLSLSALGYVIQALQRKNRHIPYRNSKLTQVLKDSLGDDSKTLMLVHVSPKEEDLCETICSLNFATRAKNIHLGNEDTIDIREQKEAAMANLQQKMQEIEHKRENIKREIEKLENRLENLTGKCLSSDDRLALLNFTEEPYPQNRVGDTTEVPISKLPGFMRPTICSRRKLGMMHQTSNCDVPRPRRRKPSSHRAESVSFPVKDHSDYRSECSISRSSCLVGLDMRINNDNATEYSQEASEIDVQMIDLRDHEKVPRNSAGQMATTSNIQKITNIEIGKSSYNKFRKVDDWLHVQKNGANIASYTNRSTRVLALPAPEKKHGRKKQNKGNKASGEANILSQIHQQNVVNFNEKAKTITNGETGKFISELVTDKKLIMLQDLFNGGSKSDSVPVIQTNDGEIMIQTQESLDISSAEDDQWRICSLEGADRHQIGEYEDDDRENALQAVEVQQLSDDFQLQNHEHLDFSQARFDACINHSKGDFCDSMSQLELERCHEELTNESNVEDGERKDSRSFIQPMEKERAHDILRLRSRKSLFRSYSNRKNLIEKSDQPRIETQTREGIFHILRKKVETLAASTLLGLGFCSLGYGEEFFYSLII